MITTQELKDRLKGIVVYIDIETSPNVGPFWRAGQEQSISHEQVILERQIISIQYKISGDSKVTVKTWTMPNKVDLQAIRLYVDSLDCIPEYNKDVAVWLLAACSHTDKYLLEHIIEVLRNAQVIVGQNHNRFDMPWIKGRLMYHSLPPVNNLILLDTLQLSRRNFNLNSHKLDYKGKFQVNDTKVMTHYSDWLKVMGGDKITLSQLCDVYGAKDVDLLEDVFLDMLPYCDKIPAHLGALISGDRGACPHCGGALSKHGTRTSATGIIKQRWYCKDCGHSHTDSRALKHGV